MTQPEFSTPVEAIDPVSDDGRKRKLVIGGGVGALALVAIGGYVLLSGGSSDSASEPFVPVTHHAVTATATPTPSATTSAEAVLPVYHGDVDGRDPFALPAAVAAAASPAAAPAGAAVPAAAGAAAAATPAVGATALPPGLTLPTTVTGGTTVTTLPGATTTTAAPVDQYLQLLRVHHNDNGWTVDVRSASGIVLGVTSGTKNVANTLFYFAGEDETSGKPTFVFELGESKGGNLIPNAKESAKHPHADKSTLYEHNGSVDGGIYSE